MSDVVLRIQSISQQGIEGVRAFKAEVLEANKASAKLATTNRETGEAAVAAARKAIAAEQEKVKVLREQISVAREVTSSYERGSEARQLATKREIELQRKLQVAFGETAAVSSKAGAVGKRQAEESGLLRGAASRSGIAGTGLAALAGPGFIAGAVTAGVLDYGVKAAIDEQKVQANLANALKDTGNARAATRKQTEEYVKTEERLTGFSRDEITQTLSTLIRSTGSLSKARKDESIMADIARARQTDLAGAQMLVLRASMGNVGALRRLGIDIPKVTTHVDALKAAHLTSNVALAAHAKALDLAATKQEVMRAVTQKFAGDSKAYMGTFAGTTDTLRNTVHDLAVELGDKAIPPLTKFFQLILKGIDWLKQSKAAHQLLHMAVEQLRLTFQAIGAVFEHVYKPMFEWLYREFQKHQTIAHALEQTFKDMFFPLYAANEQIRNRFGSLGAFFKRTWDVIVAATFEAWDRMKIGAVKTVLAIVEPFSHLPGDMGKWARDMKDNLHGELLLMNSDAARQAAIIGGTAGKAMFDAFSPWMAQITASGTNAVAGIGGFQPGGAHARGGTPAGSGSPGGSKPGSFTADTVVRTARGQLGIPYKLGGAQILGHPTDCAGLAHAVLASVGIHIGTTSEQQWTQGTPVKWGDLMPGDLVFFDTHDKQTPPSHVGIYIGNGQFIEDPHTGASVRVSSLTSGYYHDNYMGARRYIKTSKAAGGGSGDPSADSGKRDSGSAKPKQSAADAAFEAQLKAAQQAAAAAKAAKAAKSAGLKEPSLIGLIGAIDAELKATPHELDAVERNAIAHIKALREQLHVGMSPADLAKDRVALARWGKVLKDEIAKNAKEATKAASAHAREIKAAAAEVAKAWAAQWTADTAIIDRAITEQWSAVQKNFDRETQKHLTQMQRDAAKGIQAMQRDFALQMRDFDRATQKGLDALQIAQTPEEKAAADFQAQRDAAAAAKTDTSEQTDLAAAYASGDPQQIAQALDAINQTALDRKQAGLQADADASRVAADKKVAADQQAYQDQRDALKQSLEDAEADREQARQDTYDNDQQAYQDQQDALWQHMNDVHDDQLIQFNADLKQWDTWLSKKEKRYAAFLHWLQENPVSKGIDGGAITDPNKAASDASIEATIASLGSGDSSIAAFLRSQISKQAAGGIAYRPTVRMLGDQGPEAVIPLTSQHGQVAIQELAKAISAAGGTGGANGVLHLSDETIDKLGEVLGGNSQFIANFNGHVADPARSADDFRRELLKKGRQNGSRTGSIFGGRG